MINCTIEDYGSISIDITSIEHIGDMVPILKAILVWKGYSLYTVDSVFAEGYKELEAQDE